MSLPDVEEEDEPPKIHSAPKNKKRKEMGGQNNDKVGNGAPHQSLYLDSRQMHVHENKCVCVEICHLCACTLMSCSLSVCRRLSGEMG